MIKIVDKGYILGIKEKEIETFCKKKNLKFQNISFSSIQYEEGNLLSLIVEDHNDKDAPISCKVTLNSRNDRKIQEGEKIAETKKQ